MDFGQKTLENEIREAAGRIRAARTNEQKELCLLHLGDLRYGAYRLTGEKRQIDLAKNCYLAARHFHYK